MFRTIRRFKQELTREECLAVLRSQPRGVLSLLGENGYPYGLPIDYWYNETDGKLYFHGAKEGHKIDAIRACDRRPSVYTTKDSAWQGSGRCIFAVSSCLGASPR